MTNQGAVQVWLLGRSASESQKEPTRRVDEQLAGLRQYAEERRFVVIGETAEPSTSGATFLRPGLASLLKAAVSHPRPFDVLLTESPDRISRDAVTFLTVERQLARAGIELCYTAIKTCRPLRGGEKHHSASVAAIVKKRMQENARSGFWPRMAPFGYCRVRRTDGTSKLVPDKEEARVVAFAFKLALVDGLGLVAIAQMLNASGCRRRGCARWTAFMVRRLLQNQPYAGTATLTAPVDAERIAGIRIPVPALVTRIEFFHVQRMLRERRAVHPLRMR